MKKITLLLISLLILLAVLLTIVFVNAQQIISQKMDSEKREYDMMWTKAICNDSYCQDYEIYCKNDELIDLKPITGAILVIDDDWRDPRPKEFRELMC